MVYLRQSIAAVIALASVVLLIPFVDAQVGTISSGTWQAGGATGAIAAGPAAAVLADGRILVAGRTSVTGTASATVAIYNPVTGTWTSAGSLLQARTGHTATTLASGLVLIAGGKIPLAGGLFTVAGSFELFNPATGTSTAVTGAGLAIPRSGHAAARLLDGRVLFVGGANNLGPLDIAEIYDPATNTVSPVSGQMLPGRSNLSATTLADGRVLVAGGRDSAGSDLAIAQIFDPALGTFSAIPAMGTPRSGHAAVLLPANNNILIFGGASNGTSLSSAETYDAATGAWTTAASMAAPRVGGFAAATSDGGAVAIGGGPTSAEFYRFVAMSSGSSGTPGGTGGGTSTPGGTSPSATSPATPGQLLDFPLTGHPSIPGSGGTFGYPFIELTNSVLDHVHQNELFGETTWNASTQALTMKMYPQWLTFASAPFWYQAGSLAQSTDENLAISPCNQPGTFTDINHNGVRDFWEDTNGNGVLDPGEDMNGNGILDLEPPIECGRFEVHAQVDGQGQLVGAGTSTDVLMRGHIIKEHFDSTLLQWITDVNLNGTLLTGRIVEFGSQNPSSDAVLSSFCPFGSSKQADGLCHAADGSTSTPMCQAGFSANADGSCHSRAGRFTFRVLVTGGLLVDPTGPGCVQPSCFINIPGDVLDRNLDLGIDIKTANISGSFASGAISGYASGTAGTIPRVSGLSPTTTTLTLEPGPYTYRGTPFTATAAATASDGLHVEIPVVYTGDCTNVTAAGCTATATFHGDSTHADSSATQTITIVPRPITFRADDVTRIYAETTPAFGYSVSAGSIIGGDTFGAPIFTPDGINAGSHSIVLSGLSNPDYAISFAPGTLTVTPRALGVTALGEDKIYDGTTSATVTLGDNRIPTDSFTTSYVSASFADKNAGVAKTIQVAGISISGIDAANYTVNTSTTTNADIAPRSLVVSAAGVNKVYNGTTAATVTLNDDRVAGDILTTTYAAANFGDRNVGNGKAVSVTGIGLGGPDAGNYTANTTASTTANITARPLVVSATGVNKVYDGTTAAHVTLSDDRVTGDDITTSYASASFADANAGTAKPVSVAGISIAGTSAANYAANATATTTADITARPLTVTAAGVNKVYDGTTAAGVTLSDNRLSGDVLTASYGSANFADKHAGVAKAVSVAGITLTGAAAHNYAANATAATTADITPRSLTIAAAGVNKVYDGTPAATVTLSDNRVSGDLFTDAYTSAVFADARVGVGKPVDVTGISINGADAGNYNVNATASAVAHITPKAASVTPNTASKTYGTADPALTGTLAGFLAGDSVTASYTRAAGETVAGGPYAISATLTPAGVLGNYTVTYNTANFTITKASASVTPAAASKTYGTADPAFAGTLTGFRASDGVTASYTRVAGETVAGGPYAISATLTPAGVLGNYTVTYNTANFTITRASASVTPAAASKTYGTADPAFTGTLNGFLASDGVTASYTRAAGETVAGGPYAISAALNPASVLGNYTVTYNTANFTITRATASVTPNAASKTYGTADPAFTGTLTGFRASDSVTASYSRVAGETVAGGPYAISATLTPGTVLDNYTVTYNTANFTITKATASVSATGGSFTYNGAAQAGSGSATGGRGESLPVTLSYAGTGTTVYGPTATAPANAGSYTVVASTTGDGNNAGGSSTPAPLTINKAAATVTLSSLTRAFTGTPLTPTATTTPAGLAVDWTGAPQTNAGSYPVTATINDRNYQGSASGTFVINPAAATATSTLAVSNLQPQYSDQDTFTVTVTSSAPGQPAAGVNFFVGSQQVGSPTPVTVPLVVVGDPATSTTYKAVWTGQLLEPTPTGQMKPGTHIVTAAFVNPNFTVTAPAGKSVNIVREDARLAGLDRTSYSLGGSATGVIPLTVTVKDISAMVGDAAFDAFAGDIRNAQVQFIDRATNTAIGTATVNALVGPGTTTGTATLNWSVNLGTATSKSYTIGFAVVNYYTRSNQTADNVVITVSR